MPRVHEVQSGLDDGADASDAVDYEGGEDLREMSGSERDDSEYQQPAHHRGWKERAAAPSSSQQVNAVKQSALNAQAAASAAASHESSSSSAENGKSMEWRVAALVKRCERKMHDLSKRERELEERERASASKSSKRSKSSSSDKHSSDELEWSDDGIGSGSDDESVGNGDGKRDRSSSSRGSEGKDITLRQYAIRKKFEMLKYVDIDVFFRDNLNVRKAEKLAPIEKIEQYSAAWASLNLELQQYLINASRGADALMVSKYYSQIVRLLTDYSTQWRLIMELDTYIRGDDAFTVNERIVWSIDRDDDHVSRYLYDIRFNHRAMQSRPPPAQPTQSTPRGAYSNARRSSTGSGINASNSNSSKEKSPLPCFMYNGYNKTVNEWNSTSHCYGDASCKFTHRCVHCKVVGHAIYERAECAAHARPVVPPRQSRRG